MEKRICKNCGSAYYFDAEYCMFCQEKLEVERIGQLSDVEVENEYNRIIEAIINSASLSKENEKHITRLMMAKGNAPLNLQAVCAKFDIYDIPEVFIGAENVIVEELNKKWLAGGKKNYSLLTALEMAQGKEESISRCSTECYELIPEDFEIDDEDFSKVKLNIVTPEGKNIEIEDFLGPFINEDDMPYEMIGKEREDNGREVTYRVGERKSAFLPRFSDFTQTNTYGGYTPWDFDDFESCEECDGEMEHIAQIGGVAFHFDEGVFFISKCKDCGKYVVQYFQT